MDKIFELYEQLIARPNEYSVCMDSNRHRQNINYFMNSRKEEIDLFLQHFVRAFKILAPRVNAKRKYINVKSLGGHIEIKEPGYYELLDQYQKEVDEVLKHYRFIMDLENDIANEYRLIESENCQKAANDYEFNLILDQGITPATGKQLEIGF